MQYSYFPKDCQEETEITDKRLTIADLNKVIALIGSNKKIVGKVTQSKGFRVEGGRPDILGKTVKGNLWVFEHQDKVGRADQIHTAKLGHYAGLLSQTHGVDGAFLLCDTVPDEYLELYEREREVYNRRPTQRGDKNLHIIKSRWDDRGNFCPALFTGAAQPKNQKHGTLNHYNSFVQIYAADWNIQREEKNSKSKTLWHRIPQLDDWADDGRFMAYVHTCKNSIKIGVHCEKKKGKRDIGLLQAVAQSLASAEQAWQFRNTAKNKCTVELILPSNSCDDKLADSTEQLKRTIRSEIPHH